MYFPELRKLYTDSTPVGVLTILEKGLVPADIKEMGAEGILAIFAAEKIQKKSAEDVHPNHIKRNYPYI